MLACLLGCDSLFELGYISVDEVGIIEVARDPYELGPLDEALAQLKGRKISLEMTEPRKAYFKERRASRSRGSF